MGKTPFCAFLCFSVSFLPKEFFIVNQYFCGIKEA